MQVSTDKDIDIHRAIAEIEQGTKASQVVDQHSSDEYPQYCKKGKKLFPRQELLFLHAFLSAGKECWNRQQYKKRKSEERCAVWQCRETQV